MWVINVDFDPLSLVRFTPECVAKPARPDLSIAEPVVFSTVPSGGAID